MSEFIQGNITGLLERGYLEKKPEEVSSECDENTQAFYMVQRTDRIKWRQIAMLKERTGMKMMWELQCLNTTLQDVFDVVSLADMWSLNAIEAEQLFGIPRDHDEDMLNALSKLPIEMTFYRVGKRGSYVIEDNHAVFCPSIDPFGISIDPTGCGNGSTGAAMVAHMEGYSSAMTAVMANIAAGYIAAQYGPYPCVTEKIRKQAMDLAKEKYEEIFGTLSSP